MGNTILPIIGSATERTQGIAPSSTLELPSDVVASSSGSGSGSGIGLSVASFGAAGDGSTDDTDAIQEALDSGEDIFFPPGTYKVGEPLRPQRRNVSILGANRAQSIIKQYEPNIPIILFEDEGSDAAGLSEFVKIASLGLHFNDAPTDLTDQQYAIQYRPKSDGISVSGKGYIHHTLEDLDIIYASVGVGTYTADDGASVCPFWSSVIRDVRFRGIKKSALSIRSAGSAGSTDNLFQKIAVHNWYNGNEIQATGAALDLKGVNGSTLETVNIESWYDTIVNCNVCENLTFINLRAEWLRCQTGFSRAVYLADGSYNIDGLMVASLYRNNSNYFWLLQADGPTTRVNIDGLSTGSTVSGTGTVAALGGTNGAQIVANAVNLESGVSEYLPSTTSSSLYGRVLINGLPPEVNVLPAASSTYRDRSFRLTGATGRADRVYRCSKLPDDTYAWGLVGPVAVHSNGSVPSAVANTTTETSLGSSYVIPANTFRAGKAYRITARGVYGTAASAPTLRIRAKLGSTQISDSGSNTATSSLTNRAFEVLLNLVCLTTGASGTVDVQGFLRVATSSTGASHQDLENSSAITIDTTADQTLDLFATFGTADPANTITLRQLLVEELN